MQCLLVHSPLVGPTTWRWVADALRAAGHDVEVPDLRPAAATGRVEEVVRAVASAVPPGWSRPLLVGHSGAGFFLPLSGARVDAAELVFVDAGLPPCDGRAAPGDDFIDRLRSLAVDGTLPPWSSWWGDDVMAALVPDELRRSHLVEEMAELPLALFDSPVAMPAGWCDAGVSYLLLSEAYRDDARRARALGWPLVERLGGHLDLVTHPDVVAEAIEELAALAPTSD